MICNACRGSGWATYYLHSQERIMGRAWGDVNSLLLITPRRPPWARDGVKRTCRACSGTGQVGTADMMDIIRRLVKERDAIRDEVEALRHDLSAWEECARLAESGVEAPWRKIRRPAQ